MDDNMTKITSLKEYSRNKRKRVCEKCTPNLRDRKECWLDFDGDVCKRFRAKQLNKRGK